MKLSSTSHNTTWENTSGIYFQYTQDPCGCIRHHNMCQRWSVRKCSIYFRAQIEFDYGIVNFWPIGAILIIPYFEF